MTIRPYAGPAAILIALMFSACGSSNASTHLPPTTSSSAQPTIAVSPTAKPNTLDLTQVGIVMTIPQGLTQVTYQARPSQSQTDPAGTAYTSQEFDLTTPEFASAVQPNPGVCTPPYTEVMLLVLDTDPTKLVGQGFGSAADGQVGSRWLVIEAPGGGSCNPNSSAVLSAQLTLLRQMAGSATAD